MHAISKSYKGEALILVFLPKLEMRFRVGKGIIFGLCSRSQDFTISGCPLALHVFPFGFHFSTAYWQQH